MSDTVWLSRAMAHASNMRPLRHTFSDTNQAQSAIEWANRNAAGEPLPPEYFPSEIFGAPHAEEKDYKLPDLFYGYGYWVVSKAAADILRQFDLGQGGLFPVAVLKADRRTPVGGEWFCINFGNLKSAFLPEESPKARQGYIRNGLKGWFPRATLADNDFAVSTAALEGPDIWLDPIVGDAFFISDALAKALKKAKADKGFFLSKCRVI